ncbi:hypothetical protein Ahy_B04g073232 [Arachis hypogaea]|uniref:Aminotransferase-like plant mobile domain-containing protein n=1 Tax=Arachis hypogaea TaxID=3818 RepID=A0A444ZPY7_ARAHY|nr:hypothetical protein Ahy_B04g073232 [Arachis hypogaea]
MGDDPDRLYRLDGVAHIAGVINDEKFAVNYSWFQEMFGECPEGADEETVRRYAQAYIMMLLGTQLFGDKSGNHIHIRWLPYVARLEDMSDYSWGSAALAWLYQCMCRVANRHVVKPAGYDTFNWPLASRWSGHNPSASEKGPRVQMWRLRMNLLQAGDLSRRPLGCASGGVGASSYGVMTESRADHVLWFDVVADPGPSHDFLDWLGQHGKRFLSPEMYLGDSRSVPIPVEATQRGARRVPEMDRVDDVLDRRRVERRAHVGTRRSQREWRWLDQAMEEGDAMQRGGGRRRGCGGRRRARAGVDDHGGHGDDDDDGGVSPRPGGHGGEWYGSGMGDDLGQGDGGLGSGSLGDYFVGVPGDDHAVHESQTWVSPGTLFSDLLPSDDLDAEFGGSHFLDEISAIMHMMMRHVGGSAHEYFALGGTSHSADTGGAHSVAGPSRAPVHGESLPLGSSARPLPVQPRPPPQADLDDDEDDIEDKEPLVRRSQRTRIFCCCFTGSHLFR